MDPERTGRRDVEPAPVCADGLGPSEGAGREAGPALQPPTRVLQVLGSSAGGVARHVGQLAGALAGAGSRVVVGGPREVAADVAPEGSQVTHVTLEITDRPGRGDVAVVRTLRALARGADVVHAHGLRAGATAVVALRARRSTRQVPLVVTLHNLPVGGLAVRATAAVLERVVARGADVVLGVSGDLVRRQAARGATRTDRALVPAPARPEARDRALTRAELGLADDVAVLLTVGRLAPQKGLAVLADAAAMLDVPEGAADLVWLVAGDGPLRPWLADRIEAEGLPVRLLGRRSDVGDLLAAADVVVSTSRWEGQPLGVQEALQLGAVVVATDVGGTAEVTGDAAVLVPYDAAALAAALTSVLGDDERRAALRAAALDRAATLPGVADMLGQAVRVYAAARTSRAG